MPISLSALLLVPNIHVFHTELLKSILEFGAMISSHCLKQPCFILPLIVYYLLLCFLCIHDYIILKFNLDRNHTFREKQSLGDSLSSVLIMCLKHPDACLGIADFSSLSLDLIIIIIFIKIRIKRKELHSTLILPI